MALIHRASERRFSLRTVLLFLSLVAALFAVSYYYTTNFGNVVLRSSRSSELTAKAEKGKEVTPLPHAKPKIQQISLLGERNSGTRWIYDHLLECFGDQITVKNRLIRHKHWFQHDVFPELRVNSTLVIAQFRDPFYWVDGMQRKPHHAPMHYKLPSWKFFLNTPWTLPERTKLDRDYIKMQQKGSNSSSLYPCQDNFQPHQVISCLLHPFANDEEYEEYMAQWRGNLTLPSFSGRSPLYELNNDGSGNPYKNILAMRVDKIHHFLSLSDWSWIDEVLVTQYEKFIDEGTDGLLSYVERKIPGLHRNCTAFLPQPDRIPKKLNKKFVEWINANHDWDTEALIGYFKQKL